MQPKGRLPLQPSWSMGCNTSEKKTAWYSGRNYFIYDAWIPPHRFLLLLWRYYLAYFSRGAHPDPKHNWRGKTRPSPRGGHTTRTEPLSSAGVHSGRRSCRPTRLESCGSDCRGRAGGGRGTPRHNLLRKKNDKKVASESHHAVYIFRRVYHETCIAS